MLPALAFIPKKGWAAIGVILVAALIGFGGYGWGYGSGKAAATENAAEVMEAYREEVRERERAQAMRLAEANELNTELEQKHEKRISDIRSQLAEANAEAAARDADTIERLRSGTERLLLATTDCDSTEAGDSGPSAAGTDGTRRAELAPETSAALWSISGDGDRAVRKLTALQAWAKSAVELCAGGKE